jgi:hypothetical protein
VTADASLVGARIVTPGDWVELDLDPATRHRSIRRAVQRAVAQNRGLQGNAVRLIALLDDISRRAEAGGAFYCASLVLHDATSGALLVANLLLQITPDADVPPPAHATAMEVCAGLAAVVSADPDWHGAAVGVVHLPLAGPAVRVEVVAGGVLIQYLVPVPRTGRQVVLTFSSPCPPYVEALLGVFDAMAASFALDYDPIAASHPHVTGHRARMQARRE